MPGSMDTAGVPTPTTVNSPAFQHPFATPSPLYNSVASTTGRRTPAVLGWRNLVIRSLAFVFSFVAVLALIAPSVDEDKCKGADCGPPSTFRRSPEFRYWITATILSSFYSALQLFKSIWDIAFKGCIIPDMMSDYLTFILDQMVTYLLLSSSSISIFATKHVQSEPFKSVLVVSICASLFAFFVTAACSLVSGHKLCKRRMW